MLMVLIVILILLAFPMLLDIVLFGGALGLMKLFGPRQ